MSGSEWDIEWGQQGLTSAAANGVDRDEVIDALNSTRKIQLMATDGMSVWVIGLADTQRVITVVLDRVKYTRIMEIVFARPAAADESQLWERSTTDGH